MKWHDRIEKYDKDIKDAREPGDIDYARIIHSGSFRRLQGKTQILNLGDSDFYRTRLTHSLEVAQIACGVAAQLEQAFPESPAIDILPGRSMIQAIASTHDLGHPPFGHGGEVALNYCMRGDAGGFEGNGHTLRILSRLEKFSENAGSNLCRETLLGVLKYPVVYKDVRNSKIIPKLTKSTSGIPLIDVKSCKPPKCYFSSEQKVIDWLLAPLNNDDRDEFQKFIKHPKKHFEAIHKSLACSIMDTADDISFAVHDFEDALAMRLVKRERFISQVPESVCEKYLDYLNTRYAGKYGNNIYEEFVDELFSDDGAKRKHQISRILNYIIPSVEFVEIPELTEPRIKYRARLSHPADELIEALKNFVRKDVIFSPSVQHLEFKGQVMVVKVFEVIESNPKRFLPIDVYKNFEQSDKSKRVICDFVAGMTDGYLLKTYERLFSPHMGSVFDKL